MQYKFPVCALYFIAALVLEVVILWACIPAFYKLTEQSRVQVVQKYSDCIYVAKLLEEKQEQKEESYCTINPCTQWNNKVQFVQGNNYTMNYNSNNNTCITDNQSLLYICIIGFVLLECYVFVVWYKIITTELRHENYMTLEYRVVEADYMEVGGGGREMAQV
jgi:hypothetical protein